MLLLAAAALLAQSPTAAAPAPVAAEDPIVCKTDKDADLGSNIRRRKKTCMRASEWKQQEILLEHAKMKIFNGSRGSGAPGATGAGGQ